MFTINALQTDLLLMSYKKNETRRRIIFKSSTIIRNVEATISHTIENPKLNYILSKCISIPIKKHLVPMNRQNIVYEIFITYSYFFSKSQLLEKAT